jgi:integrase
MLTELSVRALKAAPHGRLELWDGRVPGFGVRVSPKGTKTFVLLYRCNGRSRRLSLGRYPMTSLAHARKQAMMALGDLARGIDPGKSAGVTPHRPFDATVDLFVRTYCGQHNRESTRRETERLLKARFVSHWGSRDLGSVGTRDILAILDKAIEDGLPSAANHALATIRLFFNWCVDRGLLESNPCGRLKMPGKKVSRDRVLSDDELARIWRAAGLLGFPFGTLVRLLLLTGQRRSEVAGMRWRDLDLREGLWHLPGTLTKNGVGHVVPLVPMVVALLQQAPRLDDEFVFPARAEKGRPLSGFSKSKARLAQLANVDAFTLHDFRRTAATGLASLGVAPHVIERLLNHVTGTLGGVAGVYNRYRYRDEVRQGLLMWTNHLVGLEGAQAARRMETQVEARQG